MNKVISLFDYGKKQDDFSRFVVFKTYCEESLFALSPDIMKISTHIYVADMTSMESYFRGASFRAKMSVQEFIEMVLAKDIHSFLSVSCEHPFQGLVLINHLLEKDVEGHFLSDSLFLKKLYPNISFKIWISTAKKLESIYSKNKILVSQRKDFHTNMKRFEKFLSHLKISNFGELKKVEFFEIQRRYKSFIGLLWKWSFPVKDKNQKEEINLFNYSTYEYFKGFQWISYRFFENPVFHHFLDFPVSTWSLIEPHLKESLLKLSQDEEVKAPRRIMELVWTITLYDSSTYSLNIPFKYPLCVEEDANKEFKITLNQFLFAFEKFESLLKQKNEDLEFINVNLILGWSVEVTKTINPSRKTANLFDTLNRKNEEQEKIIDLERKISGEIKVYKSKPNHLYGLDFFEDNVALVNEEKKDTASSLMDSKSFKPFFIYSEPIVLNESEILYSRFLERSSTNWWVSRDIEDSFRDYYICETRDNNLIWAFKNYQEKWFKHGLFS